MELYRFFFNEFDSFAYPIASDESELAELRSQSTYSSSNSCLLVGPEHSGKTSLLLQFAYSCALEQKYVTFVCSRNKMKSSPPVFPHNNQIPSQKVLQRIKIKYVEDSLSLRQYCANLHLFNNKPRVLIVDDLTGICGQFVSEAMKALGFLQNGLEYLNDHLKKSDPSASVILLVSMVSTAEIVASHIHLCERFTPLILKIQGSRSPHALTIWKHRRRDPSRFRMIYSITPESFQILSVQYDTFGVAEPEEAERMDIEPVQVEDAQFPHFSPSDSFLE
eukprot:TRINITY_DN10766_c0_g1_i1.p1 TRINITY_DN10766_c0_g1~~TRINITY_DN10766_c0_g1_i1.p1  ORF type:complete len:278 (-),score=28.64 TRINITY_DN10766_c0_g1_i1:8-841(-)